MLLQDLIRLNDCKFIFNELEKAGGESRFVGGCVRNAILNQPIKDIDIATTLSPETVENIFKQHSDIKLVSVGRDHGTIMVVMHRKTYEITTLRRDIETDGRHATVEYTTDWEVDAARRDFTINAMSYSPDEDKLYDYFHGQADAAAGLIRFVGLPEQRVQEDYLRIIRLFRFYACYGRKIDEPSLAACRLFSFKLSSISQERKAQELLKIIEQNRCIETLELMLQQDILEHLQFGIHWSNTIQRLSKLLSLADSCSYNVSIALRIFALFNTDKTYGNQLLPIHSVGKYLQQLHSLVKSVNLEAIMALPYRYLYLFKDALLDGLMYMLSTSGISELEARTIMKKFEALHGIALPQFPLTGNDIMHYFSMQPGVKLGHLIHTAKQLWFESECSATKSELLERLKRAIMN